MSSICTTQGVKDVWLGRDNTFDLRADAVLSDDTRVPVDLSDVTQMEFMLGGHDDVLTVGFGTDGDAINWLGTDQDTGVITFTLGPWAESIGVNAGIYPAQLTVFSAESPNGIVSSDYPSTFKVQVVEGMG